MEIQYILDDIPPSNNKFIGQNKRWEYQTAKKEWAQIILAAVWNNRPKQPLEKSEVTLTYTFPDKRRRDPDNYSGKFILDGLVRAGVLKDDSFDNIRLILNAKYEKGKKRTTITVKEI